MKLRWYFKKSFETLKNEGLKIFILKTKYYIINRFQKDKTKDMSKICADVLFINGTFLPHPASKLVASAATSITENNFFFINLIILS